MYSSLVGCVKCGASLLKSSVELQFVLHSLTFTILIVHHGAVHIHYHHSSLSPLTLAPVLSKNSPTLHIQGTELCVCVCVCVCIDLLVISLKKQVKGEWTGWTNFFTGVALCRPLRVMADDVILGGEGASEPFFCSYRSHCITTECHHA